MPTHGCINLTLKIIARFSAFTWIFLLIVKNLNLKFIGFEQHAGLLAKYITFAKKLLESFKFGRKLWVSDLSNSRENMANALIL